MASAARVFRNLYRDSVSLMQLSAKLGALAGVRQASAIMATAGNLDLLREAGLAPAEVEAGPNDLLVALEGEDEALEGALAAAEAELTRRPQRRTTAVRAACRRAASRWRSASSRRRISP